jgi:hypothetical protein
MDQKAKQRYLKWVFMAFKHTKKVEIGSFIKARNLSGPKRPDSDTDPTNTS